MSKAVRKTISYSMDRINNAAHDLPRAQQIAVPSSVQVQHVKDDQYKITTENRWTVLWWAGAATVLRLGGAPIIPDEQRCSLIKLVTYICDRVQQIKRAQRDGLEGGRKNPSENYNPFHKKKGGKK